MNIPMMFVEGAGGRRDENKENIQKPKKKVLRAFNFLS